MKHADVKVGDLLKTSDLGHGRTVLVLALTAEEFPSLPDPDKLIVVLDNGARLPARPIFLDPSEPSAFVL